MTRAAQIVTASGPPRRPLTRVLQFLIPTLIWGSTWLVIREQIETVPAAWSVAFRFAIATCAMVAFALLRGETLRLKTAALRLATVVGICEFCISFNAIYVAERHVTSGLVGTTFALLVIPNAVLGWLLLGRPLSARFVGSSLVAIAGVVLLFLNEFREAHRMDLVVGVGFATLGVIAASIANVSQASIEAGEQPLFCFLAWAMGIGTVADVLLAAARHGAPAFDLRFSYLTALLYLAVVASVLAYSLYYPLVRSVGPGKAAYTSLVIPIIAMSLSSVFESYHWTLLAASGAVLALAGMAVAMTESS
jgi:drug/metabolite transporter (DMT)-like permease